MTYALKDAEVKGGCETSASAILKGILIFLPAPAPSAPLPSSSPCVRGPRVSPGWGWGSGSFARVTLGFPTVHTNGEGRLKPWWLKPFSLAPTFEPVRANTRVSPLRVGSFMVAERRS